MHRNVFMRPTTGIRVQYRLGLLASVALCLPRRTPWEALLGWEPAKAQLCSHLADTSQLAAISPAGSPELS